MFGEVVIPLYEEEVVKAVDDLIDDGIEALAIVFVYSHLNPMHERKAAEIANRVAHARKRELVIRCSSDIAPIVREYSRLFSTLIQVSASEPSRQQLLKIEETAKEKGYPGRLLTQLSYGGLTDIRYERLYETLISGPVGGYSGSKYVGDLLGEENVLTIDLGGTSLDVGIIRAGIMDIIREPTVAGLRINLPMLNLEAVGGGTGTAIRVNPITKRIELGPDSAGDRVGMCYKYPVPTITDCSLILDHLDPDYFVGGEIKLNKEAALKGVQQIADELGIDVYEVASGILDLQSTLLRSHLQAMLLSRGYSPHEFVAMIYGGAGPLHMHTMCKGIPFKDVITFPFAGVFSAFGTLTTDYAHRYARSLTAPLPPLLSKDEPSQQSRAMTANRITQAWRELKERATTELRSEGISLNGVTFKHFAYMRYTGQFQDYETLSPLEELSSPEDTRSLINAFEDTYGKIYPEGSKYPEAGYMISEVAVIASFALPKPLLERRPLKAEDPPLEAHKSQRKAYYNRQWQEFTVWEMDWLDAGNVVKGPAIIEHPATTLLVPPARQVRFDELRIIHYA
jgi:N-methylhydantoinase A